MRGTPRYSGQSRAITIQVDPSDQYRLNKFFRQELGLYNTLISIFESRVRAFPKSILEIPTAQVNLFCDLARHNLNIRDLVRDPSKWPTEIYSHKSTVFDKNDRLMLNSTQLLMFEQAGRDRYVMLPEAKRQMASAVVEYFKEQAEILSQPQKSDKVEISYRSPPRNLSVLDFSSKRHAQIPRADVNVRWNHEQERTEILTPLNARPMIIPSFNLNEFNGWTTMIIKQESGQHVDPETPWVADFKNTGGKYLLTYNDLGSRNSSKGPR